MGSRASGAMDGAAYRKIVETGDLSGLDADAPERYSFLKERPTGATLEGYLFLTPTSCWSTKRPRRRSSTGSSTPSPRCPSHAALSQVRRGARSKPLTLHQALTLASIVEREAGVDADRPMIAGVYLNRLAKGIKLEADPTVQYAMGFQPQTGQWWKSPVYLEEYSKVVSPYNTYLNVGLPPGPIANPGLKEHRGGAQSRPA